MLVFQDGESGWSSLHRALHFGHLAVASVLLQSGASTIIEDSKLRTPIDLLSGPLSQILGNQRTSGWFNCLSVIIVCHDWMTELYFFLQLLLRYLAGAVVLITNLELEMLTYKSYHAKWTRFMVHLLS